MKIEEKSSNGIGIISISENLTMAEIGDLKGVIKPYLENKECTGLICNLEQVNRIDSAGIGIITSIFKSVKESKKSFVVSGVNQQQRELLNIAQLDKVLLIAKNETEALQMLIDLS